MKTAVIIGGSSGIGFRVAERIIADGGRVILGGRSADKLAAAQARLGNAASVATIDSGDKQSIAAFFAGIARIDYLFTPGASYRYGPVLEVSDDDAESPFRVKFWGQYWAVRHALPKMAEDGAIVLMSGAAGARPLPGAATYAAANSAIEGLGRALAVEIAPIRVNVVSPGTTDSELWRNRPAAQREAAYAGYGKITALGRVGTVDEVADAVLFLLRNGFMTGSTLYPDGGYTLR